MEALTPFLCPTVIIGRPKLLLARWELCNQMVRFINLIQTLSPPSRRCRLPPSLMFPQTHLRSRMWQGVDLAKLKLDHAERKKYPIMQMDGNPNNFFMGKVGAECFCVNNPEDCAYPTHKKKKLQV